MELYLELSYHICDISGCVQLGQHTQQIKGSSIFTASMKMETETRKPSGLSR